MGGKLGGVTRPCTHFCSKMTISQLSDVMIDFEMIVGRLKLFQVVCKEEEYL